MIYWGIADLVDVHLGIEQRMVAGDCAAEVISDVIMVILAGDICFLPPVACSKADTFI